MRLTRCLRRRDALGGSVQPSDFGHRRLPSRSACCDRPVRLGPSAPRAAPPPRTPLTYAARDAVVPLGQRVGHRLTAHGRGALQQVPGVALEADDGAGRELGPDPPSVPGLGDGAALGVTGPRHSWGQSTAQTLACASCRGASEHSQGARQRRAPGGTVSPPGRPTLSPETRNTADGALVPPDG